MEETAKFYLVEQMPFTLDVLTENRGSEAIKTAKSNPLSRKIREIRRISGDSSGSLQKYLTDKLILEDGRALKWTISMRSRNTYDYYGAARGTGETEFCVTFDTGTGMKDVFEEAAFLQVDTVELRANTSGGILCQQLSSKEMPLTIPQEGSQLACVDSSFNATIVNLLGKGHQVISGKMNIILIVNPNNYRGPSEREKTAVFKRMLEEELATDAVILPKNGAEVKCHREILAAHSDVFQTMFATDMKEANTRKIEMPDMSEEGVRAFLAYLYHWDQSQAEKKCSVAVELLKAGHKYNVRFLEKSMRKLLLCKPDSWYHSVDVAMKLFLFVHSMDAEWDSLKKKAVMVLKKRTVDLKKSPTFQELFRENPEAAMDFCQYAIAI